MAMKVNNAVFSDFYHPKCVRKLVSKVPIFVNPKEKLFWNFKMEFQVQNRIESKIIYRNFMSFKTKFLRLHYCKDETLTQGFLMCIKTPKQGFS